MCSCVRVSVDFVCIFEGVWIVFNVRPRSETKTARQRFTDFGQPCDLLFAMPAFGDDLDEVSREHRLDGLERNAAAFCAVPKMAFAGEFAFVE